MHITREFEATILDLFDDDGIIILETLREHSEKIISCTFSNDNGFEIYVYSQYHYIIEQNFSHMLTTCQNYAFATSGDAPGIIRISELKNNNESLAILSFIRDVAPPTQPEMNYMFRRSQSEDNRALPTLKKYINSMKKGDLNSLTQQAEALTNELPICIFTFNQILDDQPIIVTLTKSESKQKPWVIGIYDGNQWQDGNVHIGIMQTYFRTKKFDPSTGIALLAEPVIFSNIHEFIILLKNSLSHKNKIHCTPKKLCNMQ